jgi:hypothetical protein
MENLQAKRHIINANFRTLKYISLFVLGYAVFILSTDFLFQTLWEPQYVAIYRILDIVLMVLALLAICFFWMFRIHKLVYRKIGSLLFPFLFLIWSAVITGIDFQALGLTTFIIVLLLCTFFLYLNSVLSILYVSAS